MQSTVYLNGKRYVRDITRRHDWNGPYSAFVTFAYQGHPDEFPTVLTYVLR